MSNTLADRRRMSQKATNGYASRMHMVTQRRRHRFLINSITGGLNMEIMIVVGVLAFLFIH